MANTLSVMNFVRNVVSKKRRRFTKGGYNLDLAYICDNIIAMGYPADNLESIYRNRLEDVYKFLEENHYDHYKIYNLCLERSYDINKFHRRVAVYPFEDHNPPTIELIQNFCDDVDSWLKADTLNVAAVHCKAGKGRTGTMICCYLLYSGQKGSAEDALACYDEKRTKDGKGVTIPSQRRYVQYFSKLIRSGLPYERRTLQFCEIRFTEAHILLSHGTVNCSISELQDTGTAGKVQALQNLTIDFRKSFTLDIKNPTLCVAGDIKVELTQKISKKKIFHLWFNTFFVYDAAKIEGDGDDAKLVYTLNKCEIDDAHKDKEHKYFSEDFKVQLVFYADDSTARNQSSVSHRLNNHRTSQSSGLPQNTYSLPQNSSSGSDLNYICDYKSSSTASVSSLIGGAGAESGSFDTYNRSLRSSAPNHAIYASACSNNCGERASYSDIQKHHNSVGNNVPQQQQSQTVLNTVTATSTPNSKHSVYAFTNNQRHQNQHQQQYQPSAGRDTNSNKNLNAQIIGSETPRLNHQSSHGSDSKNNSNSNTSSKSSSISSHSSSSATADNEEDWESANRNHRICATASTNTPANENETGATNLVLTATSTSSTSMSTTTTTATITPNLPSFVCDSANYMLLPSAVAVAAVAANKEVQLQTYEYLSKHHRTAVSAAVAVAAAAAVAKSGKCTKPNEEYVNVMNTTNPPTTNTSNTLAAAAAAVAVYDVHQQQQSINPTIYHTPKNLFIANNMKPRPRRETT